MIIANDFAVKLCYVYYLILGFILQGIGDSAQGFANCVFYIFFTKKIRARINICYCCNCRKRSQVADISAAAAPHCDTQQQN